MPLKWLLRITAPLVVLVALILLRVPMHGAGPLSTILPSGWQLDAPVGPHAQTGTMPQGGAISPDGTRLAVVESGFNPPALSIFETSTLRKLRTVALPGAFGRPMWMHDRVLVAGANADALFLVDSRSGAIQRLPFPKNSFPVSVAVLGTRVAVGTDGDAGVRLGTLTSVARQRPIHVGDHPAGLTFTRDGACLFVTVRSARYIAAVDTATDRVTHIATGLHPSDVLVVGNTLYVAVADDDEVETFDVSSGKQLARIDVGNGSRSNDIVGASPNALAALGNEVFVSLGAANRIAALRDGRVVGIAPAGWYPTDVIPYGNRLFVIDGKGEGARPNPNFDFKSPGYRDYVAAIEFGSIRVLTLPAAFHLFQNPQGSIGWDVAPADTIVRSGGPIKHVFFILKENRTYDQVLGDMSQGNGDAKLTWFGHNVTPNQHALAARFGLFDNMYTNGEVSAAGHNWADAGFDNDYNERYWPPVYGNRELNDNGDLGNGFGAGVAHSGYIWDAARAAGVSFRDYGEVVNTPPGSAPGPVAPPTLGNRFDPKYTSWNLKYSDVDRVKEWRREFEAFVQHNDVPQLEWIWIPNDHTAGSKPGALTPVAYAAQNDYAVGMLVDAISHSSIWNSSAIFITEDDAQDGADHVSDQRTTLYIASPYATGGVISQHYATDSVVRTIELLLGIKPMSTYDARAVPLYAAFSATAHSEPFDVLAPQVDVRATNAPKAFGSKVSQTLDFQHPDAAPAQVLNNIIAHNLTWQHNR